MTDNVAIAFGENIIGWEYVVSVSGVMACFFLSLWLYFRRKKKILPMVLFQVVAVIFSLLMCRVIYWYCHMELYSEIYELWTDPDMGHFFMFGVPLAAYLTAFCMELSGVIADRRELLDAVSPGLAFAMAFFRFSGMFSGACYGKYNISNKIFTRLPFSYNANNGSWKIAAFCISFIWLMFVSAFLLMKARSKKKRAEGSIFRLFLILFSLSEVVIDSLRYDASHFFFPGKLLADLNKGTGFMGLSQLVSAFVMIFIMAGYTVRNKKNGRVIAISWILFLSGTAVTGICEYLVQRNSSRFIMLYAVMLIGVSVMGTAFVYVMNHETIKMENI